MRGDQPDFQVPRMTPNELLELTAYPLSLKADAHIQENGLGKLTAWGTKRK